MFHVLSLFSCCLRPICHWILLETSFCDTRVFWTNLVCSERCWVSIRKQVQITASWLEPFTLKSKRIFALTFWCSIKDGLGIFKHLINWSSLKRGFCNPTQAGVSVSIRNSGKAAFNSSRSWQVGMVVITLKFASIREMINPLPVEPCVQLI